MNIFLDNKSSIQPISDFRKTSPGIESFDREWRAQTRNEIWMNWSAANGGLRDGGLSKSEDIWGKRPFSSVFWIFQVLFGPSRKGRKRQKKGEKGRFRPISRIGGQTPLKPPFVTPPFAALQMNRESLNGGLANGGLRYLSTTCPRLPTSVVFL